MRAFPAALPADAQFISLHGCIFYDLFFFHSRSGDTRSFILHSYLSTYLRGSLAAWGAANASPCHPPEGCVSHECSGSRLSISYLCVTYQSCLQPEEAITERRPLGFVRPHSSPVNNPNIAANSPPSPCKPAPARRDECEQELGERRVVFMKFVSVRRSVFLKR